VAAVHTSGAIAKTAHKYWESTRSVQTGTRCPCQNNVRLTLVAARRPKYLAKISITLARCVVRVRQQLVARALFNAPTNVGALLV
jgi:hypothetical protein